jgi:uncharacterized small protein (DUF1192 family)
MPPEGKGKAPDNNKRLAALEAGVSALAIALTANGIKLEDGQDPIEAAIAAIKSQAKDVAELTARAEALAGEVDRLTGVVGDLEARLGADADPGELEELRKRIVALTAEVGELEQDLLDMTNAKNALANQLAEQGKGTGDAGAAPSPEPAPEPEPELERPAHARDVGPAFGQLTDVAIAALVAEGGAFEIVFSNGEFEIVDFEPRTIAAKDLTRVDSSRFVVEPAIHLRGVGAKVKVHGAGLLYGGKQVAYCAFDPPPVIEHGQERRFHRALIFG